MSKTIGPIRINPSVFYRTHGGSYTKAYLAKHVGGMKNLNRLLREYPELIPPWYADNKTRAVYSITDVLKARDIDCEKILRERGIDFIYRF